MALIGFDEVTNRPLQVTAGLDLVFEFIKTYWGMEVRDTVAGFVEHMPLKQNDDPFAEEFDIPPTSAKLCAGE